MFENVAQGESRNTITDWFGRGGVALAFVVFGLDKFNNQSMWPKFFQDVGFGGWFRYFTGWVEILGGILVMIPWTATIGLALLACTMASAALILIFVLGRPGDAVFSIGFFLGISAFAWTRRNR